MSSGHPVEEYAGRSQLGAARKVELAGRTTGTPGVDLSQFAPPFSGPVICSNIESKMREVVLRCIRSAVACKQYTVYITFRRKSTRYVNNVLYIPLWVRERRSLVVVECPKPQERGRDSRPNDANQRRRRSGAAEFPSKSHVDLRDGYSERVRGSCASRQRVRSREPATKSRPLGREDPRQPPGTSRRRGVNLYWPWRRPDRFPAAEQPKGGPPASARDDRDQQSRGFPGGLP